MVFLTLGLTAWTCSNCPHAVIDGATFFEAQILSPKLEKLSCVIMTDCPVHN